MPPPGPVQRKNLRRSLTITLAFMAVKSLLASEKSKAAAERLLGPRLRNGLYRPVYILYSSVGGVWILLLAYRRPHRVLYQTRPPLSWLMRVGQLASIALTLETTRFLGAGFFGIPQLRALLKGRQPEAEPEAQGPPPEDGGELSQRSFFGFTRHPNNWFPTVFFLLEPRMTDKRAMYTMLMTIHVLLGSVHEESRLRGRYGAAYDRYKETAPFLVSLSRKR